jgi:hypothetical protein
MRWISFLGSVVILIWAIWLLLLAYRVVGKAPGQDPKYDAAMEYWSGTFKVMGILAFIALALEVAGFIVDHL